ncbi:unnamed protein product [Bodo saltans]|uniref:Uncharacterized protein n=1 Tax=Bodo saltans TaxID=75058 RepID=A0A0S4J3U4_BODSA|nr:unnamed protein product [Bodo saltans]|eukprot:CUG76820.1 unnamed protein product [Bodo saltans]
MVGEVLWEMAKTTPAPPTVLTFEDALKSVAVYVPAAALAAPLPQVVRTAFSEVLMALEERPEIHATSTPTAPLALPPVVETTAEKEAREKVITVAGVKFPRTTLRPFTSLYPHLWVGHTFVEWRMAFDELTKGDKCPDHMRFKLKKLVEIVEAWFLDLPSSIDGFTTTKIMTFNACIALLLEIHILSIPLSTTPSSATAFFAQLLEERTHNCQALNYYEDLRKVVERKGNTSLPFRQ